MAKVFSLGYTDTAIDGVTSLDFPRGLVNFGADWAIKGNGNGQELVLVHNTGSDLSVPPEKIRYSVSPVANIFAGTGVEATAYVPNRKGVSVLVQLTQVWIVTDDADPTYRVELPISCHLVLKVPLSEYVTGARLEAVVGRLVSGLFETGDLLTTRFDKLVRGSLVPSDV